jgi:hypothetical protein
MRAITTEEGYFSVASVTENILDKTKVLPEKVFKQTFKFFLFVTFDELFIPLFFNHFKRYLLEAGENDFWLSAVDPDPKLYFGANFDFFGAIEFSSIDTEEEYLAALNNYPLDSPADALVHSANSLIVFSSKYEWAIYGNRNTDIAICSFVDVEQMERFKSNYGSDLLNGIIEAANYAYGEIGNSVLKTKFFNSYSTNLS